MWVSEITVFSGAKTPRYHRSSNNTTRHHNHGTYTCRLTSASPTWRHCFCSITANGLFPLGGVSRCVQESDERRRLKAYGSWRGSKLDQNWFEVLILTAVIATVDVILLWCLSKWKLQQRHRQIVSFLIEQVTVLDWWSSAALTTLFVTKRLTA